jgi:hypothetical protein
MTPKRTEPTPNWSKHHAGFPASKIPDWSRQKIGGEAGAGGAPGGRGGRGIGGGDMVVSLRPKPATGDSAQTLARGCKYRGRMGSFNTYITTRLGPQNTRHTEGRRTDPDAHAQTDQHN